jgi:hypothetical protein
VELVDTLDSKSCENFLVTVQVRPAAPCKVLYSHLAHQTLFIMRDDNETQQDPLDTVHGELREYFKGVIEHIAHDQAIPMDEAVRLVRESINDAVVGLGLDPDG